MTLPVRRSASRVRSIGKAALLAAALLTPFAALPASWPLLQFAGTHGMQ